MIFRQFSGLTKVGRDVLTRMQLYGIAVGVLLGLLIYYWTGNAYNALLGVFIEMIAGLFEGLVMAGLIVFVFRSLTGIRRYRHIVGAVNYTIAAGLTLWTFFNLFLEGDTSFLSAWDWTDLVVILAIPAIFAGAVAWWASVRTLRWAEKQINTQPNAQ